MHLRLLAGHKKWSNKLAFIMRKLLLCLFALSAIGAFAQDEVEGGSKWYLGVGGGVRFGSMTFSNLDERVFPNEKGMTSEVFSLFLEGSFGRNGNFGIRPEFTYLRRGGKLTDIYSTETYANFYEREGIKDYYYQLNAHYLDLRVPVFFQFGNYSSKLRPYIYVAPIIGLPVGGKINVEQQQLSGVYSGYELDVNNANLASTYLAGAVGLGLKWNLNVDGRDVYLGLDGSYEFGFTNTYGSKEKDGEAIVQQHLFYNAYQITGDRKFSGFEIKAMIGISLGKKKKKQVEGSVEAYVPPVQAYVPAPVVEENVVEEKPCYSLEEISYLIKKGENVSGKVFCAIDAIQFEFDRSVIMRSSYSYLNELAKTLKETGMSVEVKGHTDNVGSDEVNMRLSRERAEAVVKYLVDAGVSASNLSYSYYGKTRPLVSNDTEEGRKQNRRVEFEILRY